VPIHAKVARVVLRLAASDQLPARLLLGSDAVCLASLAQRSMQKKMQSGGTQRLHQLRGLGRVFRDSNLYNTSARFRAQSTRRIKAVKWTNTWVERSLVQP
jgi:hypothetical protein